LFGQYLYTGSADSTERFGAGTVLIATWG
jgi:hypothetical protein